MALQPKIRHIPNVASGATPVKFFFFIKKKGYYLLFTLLEYMDYLLLPVLIVCNKVENKDLHQLYHQ